MTTYERPVKAALFVRLANGEEFEATAADLARFGYVDRLDAYIRFQDRLARTLIDAGLIERDKHLTNCAINPLRYLAETAIGHPELLDHPDMRDTYDEIVAIELALRAAGMPREES